MKNHIWCVEVEYKPGFWEVFSFAFSRSSARFTKKHDVPVMYKSRIKKYVREGTHDL